MRKKIFKIVLVFQIICRWHTQNKLYNWKENIPDNDKHCRISCRPGLVTYSQHKYMYSKTNTYRSNKIVGYIITRNTKLSSKTLPWNFVWKTDIFLGLLVWFFLSCPGSIYWFYWTCWLCLFSSYKTKLFSFPSFQMSLRKRTSLILSLPEVIKMHLLLKKSALLSSK